ncbi:VWA domain-containing protein [Candidatus Sulfidibacterium hydrothermale]|uniref:vWA domain-containing protein n=1 Tax=Candidatus Sulfidibacterium hydrothermale TaxID=2875962 RepID=UPI001F0A3E75|nr:VWA domain-containing protein [Candidatus Sulfidibacterium hydrothermale]UBM63444.1 VWA domain-containing protein [Candidatus Sulfidibacterium hydrothermale]
MFGIDTWRNPDYFYLFLLIPVLTAWYVYRFRKSTPELLFSGLKPFENATPSLKAKLIHSLFVLRMLALSFLIIALAGPQKVSSKSNINIEGIDIVIALDVSGSMRARDFQPDRIGAAKNIAIRFIKGRPNDRIGLVIFSGEAFTQAPLTLDHSVLISLLREVKSGMIQDGTAIGDGLATAVSRLKDSKARSKVIILLTDGVNNSGAIDPETAAELAKMYGIRVYTIGVGSYGYAPYPVQTPYGIQMQQMKVQIDEALLKKIARETGGKYFRANNNRKLSAIFKEIDRLEKSKINVQQFRRKYELFFPFALAALLLFVLEVSLRYVFFRRLP